MPIERDKSSLPYRWLENNLYFKNPEMAKNLYEELVANRERERTTSKRSK